MTVFYGTVEERFAELENPEAAIWAVPAFRTMRVLLDAVATHRGVMVHSDRHFFRLVQEAVGRESEWTRQHRLAAGVAMAEAVPGHRQPWEVRGVAALDLYCETATLLRPILVPDRRDAVDSVVQRIAANVYR